MEVTIDFMVPMTVRANLETGEIGEIWLHLDSFQDVYGGRLIDEKSGSVIFLKDVFFHGEGCPDEVAGKELGEAEHPLAMKAFDLVENVSITGVKRSYSGSSDIELSYTNA